MQFIPARGRKLTSRRHGQHRAKLQFTPARGRKHQGCVRIVHHLIDCNLSPQGDGNERTSIRNVLHIHCNLSPQGDGNPARMTRPLRYKHCNLSPQGDKKAPLPLAFASSGGALLFLIFYLQVGNCTCRNRLCDGQRLDALRDVPLQGADLMQVGGDLLQGLFNVLCIQRQNALAL